MEHCGKSVCLAHLRKKGREGGKKKGEKEGVKKEGREEGGHFTLVWWHTNTRNLRQKDHYKFEVNLETTQ